MGWQSQAQISIRIPPQFSWEGISEIQAKNKRKIHDRFARFTIIQTKIDKIDEAAGLFKESVVPAFKTQKGFNAAYFISERETGKNICVSIWDSEEDAVCNEKSQLYQDQLIKFMDLFTNPPYREGYEVIVMSLKED